MAQEPPAPLSSNTGAPFEKYQITNTNKIPKVSYIFTLFATAILKIYL